MMAFYKDTLPYYQFNLGQCSKLVQSFCDKQPLQLFTASGLMLASSVLIICDTKQCRLCSLSMLFPSLSPRPQTIRSFHSRFKRSRLFIRGSGANCNVAIMTALSFGEYRRGKRRGLRERGSHIHLSLSLFEQLSGMPVIGGSP